MTRAWRRLSFRGGDLLTGWKCPTVERVGMEFNEVPWPSNGKTRTAGFGDVTPYRTDVTLMECRNTRGHAWFVYVERPAQAMCSGWAEEGEHGLGAESCVTLFSARKHEASWAHANPDRIRQVTAAGQRQFRTPRVEIAEKQQ